MIPREPQELALMLNRLCHDHPGIQDLLIQKLAEILKFSASDDEIEGMLLVLQYRADAAIKQSQKGIIWETRKA